MENNQSFEDQVVVFNVNIDMNSRKVPVVISFENNTIEIHVNEAEIFDKEKPLFEVQKSLYQFVKFVFSLISKAQVTYFYFGDELSPESLKCISTQFGFEKYCGVFPSDKYLEQLVYGDS